LVRDPFFAGVGSAERVAVEEVPGVEDRPTDDGVPERTGIAEEAGPAAGEE